MTSSKITQNSSFDLSWLASYRRITVIGLGMSGIGVIRKFAEHNIHVHVQDSRENPTGLVDIEGLENVQTVVLGSFDKHGIMASDLLVVSPGVSLKTPEIQAAIEAGIEITGDIDIVSKSTNIPLLTITGSNGKSTVTQLAGEICLAAGYETFIGGNIGRSAMELLSKEEFFDIAVLELSSFQLETTENLSASVAALLNLSADHLDRYDSFEEYAFAKLAIFRSAKTIIWNRQDPWISQLDFYEASHSDKVISFGLDQPASDDDFGLVTSTAGKEYFAQGNQLICAVEDCQLIGTHNLLNVLAALAILSNFDIKEASIRRALINFQGLPHRMQKVRERHNVLWINDSKATNVGATISAIEGLQSSIILIAGGQGKGGDFSLLVPYLEKSVSHVYLMGEDAEKMNSEFQDYVPCTLTRSLNEAVTLADEKASSGDVVLLAPACASFDMFPNFMARGNQFIELVNAL